MENGVVVSAIAKSLDSISGQQSVSWILETEIVSDWTTPGEFSSP